MVERERHCDDRPAGKRRVSIGGRRIAPSIPMPTCLRIDQRKHVAVVLDRRDVVEEQSAGEAFAIGEKSDDAERADNYERLQTGVMEKSRATAPKESRLTRNAIWNHRASSRASTRIGDCGMIMIDCIGVSPNGQRPARCRRTDA